MSGHVVGIDPSLAAAGIAILADPKTVTGRNVPILKTVGAKGSANDTLPQRAIRVGRQHDAILRALPSQVRLVCIEALPYAMPKNSSLFQERAALVIDLVRFLALRKIPVVAISVTTIKMFATGNGAAKKPEVMAAMAELWPGAPIGGDDNRSDALAIATIGAQKLGWYEPELPCHYAPKIDWTGVGA